ncbi:ABC transporter substrate-binding protein [Actinomadura rudentiformis]|uniref:ABC transporter substrate-binding protein n=1 Tax=Actinomadura rudentiformis TaxID=359158 RepID=A0A6H9YPL2_9ACTN|nr:ABC transporter substrate-binding protein [Actinomadura rudentiformis]KAB2345530.1 ABC transporter substrate-binding protein [Actinomadura rudentiformis]
MSDSRAMQFSRRGFLAAGGATALGALLAACGGDDGSGSTKAGGGAWAFTDDRQKQVSLPAKPTRIVAYVGAAAILQDYGVADRVKGVFGPTKLKDGSRDPQAGELDVNKVTIIGNAYGEFNIEKYASLRPEVLVGHMFVANDIFYVPPESKDKILALAPQIAISTGALPLPKPIERYAQLAASLGADLNSAQVTAAKARFEKAAESVRQAAKAVAGRAGGLKVLACSASPDLFYASNPGKNSDLMYFKELGVDIIVPNKLDKDDYFEGLSWENADKYKADLLLLDSRTQALQPKDLGSKPSWKDLPAVKANQVLPWQPEPRFSYAGCAPILEELAKTLQTVKKVS